MTSPAEGPAKFIELRLRDINQLFNSMDPAPFHEKDLDADAEEFIVSWAKEHPSKASLRLRIHLEQWPQTDPALTAERAVHNYFLYRAQMSRRELRHLFKQGRATLLIGLTFLAACLSLGNLVPSDPEKAWTAFLREGLTIAGWVAMWRPIQTYLYDWWPLLQQVRVHERLGRMPVEVVRGGA